MGKSAVTTARAPALFAPGGTRPLSPAAVEAHRRAEGAAQSNLRPTSPSGQRERAKVGSHAVLILPDAHHPLHDRAAMAVVERVAAILRPTRIVSLGDWLEAAAFTAHPARSRSEQAIHEFADELSTCEGSVDRIHSAAGTSPTWDYLEGNHEAHVERECIRLGGLGMAVRSLIDPRTVLTRGRPWMSWTPYVAPSAGPLGRPGARRRTGVGMAHCKITRDLWAVHGWSIAKGAAQVHLDRAKTVSIVHGHTHRQQAASARVLETGKVIHAWSPGCLSDLQPPWHHGSPTDWVHGFSIVYATDDCMSRTGAWTHYTVTIDRGECVLPGGTRVAV